MFASLAVVLALVALAATLAVALALHTDVVAQQRAKDEILLRSELVERACDDEAYGVKTFLASEIKVDIVSAYRLHDIVDALTLKSAQGEVSIFFLECEQHHTADTFLVFVNVVHKNLHVYRANFGLCHIVIVFLLLAKLVHNVVCRNT